ncbi:protein naked cuticle homolog 2-like isoform X3 [Xyrichtys novacula]|uniref:Protein naked cuticle homolog n=1 Tax=Xyrichtys novacula TaxID=13765 RepID=A0AAV1HC14_XYRNO|nr:protein naked cuticle homolog 2-like isoform X3 [Xyrichtys novacula]
MGKFQSKFAPKRRQNPEGDSLTSNVLNCQRKLEQIHIYKLSENLYVEVKENKSGSSSNLKVSLPRNKMPKESPNIHPHVKNQAKKRSSHVGNVTEPNEDAQQEWVFILYNSQSERDKSSLKHSINEVLEASVKQPNSATFPMRIKLVVLPSSHPEKTPQTAPEKEVNISQEAPVRGRQCVDENRERRNHYMDLAGIENYSSKFEDKGSPSVKHRHSALQHHPAVIRENCTPSDSITGCSNPCSPKNKTTPVVKDKNGGERKLHKLHSKHPASRCSHDLHSQPAVQYTHNKRIRSGVPDAAYIPYSSRGALTSPSKRHEHHHQHEHHHHHHHHHYHPS